jgi:hypothetical protein
LAVTPPAETAVVAVAPVRVAAAALRSGIRVADVELARPPAASRNQMEQSWFERLKQLDDERPSAPGEHWITLLAGIWLLTRGGGSSLGRAARIAAGAALVWRAASGRDGLARLVGEVGRSS